jgi:hypothetical protein
LVGKKEIKMKKFIIPIICLFVALFAFLGAGNNRVIQVTHRSQALYAATYANSAVDTLYYVRDPYLVSLAFSVHFKDSVSVTNAILRRIVGGELVALQAGDTLLTGADTNFVAGSIGSSANPSYANIKAITLAPLADQYRIIVTYAASRNGVTNNNVDYIFQQVFYSQ